MSERPSPVFALGAALFCFALMQLFNGLLSLLYGQGYALGGASQLASIGAQGVAYGVPTLLYYRAHPRLKPALRLRPFDGLSMCLTVLAALVGVLAFSALSGYWTYLLAALGFHAPPRAPSGGPWGQVLLLLLASAAAPAVCEELLYRGLLLPSIEPLGRTRAVCISGVIFALMHGRVDALPGHLLTGLMLGMLALKTDSLFPAMAYHFTNNATALLIAYTSALQAAAAPTAQELLQRIPATLTTLGLWALLCFAALQRGESTRLRPLPPAGPGRLPASATILMAVLFLFLGGNTLRLFLGMAGGPA